MGIGWAVACPLQKYHGDIFQMTLTKTSEASLAERSQQIREAWVILRSGLFNIVHAGALSLDAKGQVKHGEFKAWLETEIPEASYPTMVRAMRTAERVAECLAYTPEELLAVCLAEPETEAHQDLMGFLEGKSQRQLLTRIVDEEDVSPGEREAREHCLRAFEADPDLRDEWEPKVVSGELSWFRAWLGMRGQAATKGKKRIDRSSYERLPDSLGSAWRGLEHWAQVPPEAQIRARKEFRQILTRIPEEWLPEIETALQSRRKP